MPYPHPFRWIYKKSGAPHRKQRQKEKWFSPSWWKQCCFSHQLEDQSVPPWEPRAAAAGRQPQQIDHSLVLHAALPCVGTTGCWREDLLRCHLHLAARDETSSRCINQRGVRSRSRGRSRSRSQAAVPVLPAGAITLPALPGIHTQGCYPDPWDWDRTVLCSSSLYFDSATIILLQSGQMTYEIQTNSNRIIYSQNTNR